MLHYRLYRSSDTYFKSPNSTALTKCEYHRRNFSVFNRRYAIRLLFNPFAVYTIIIYYLVELSREIKPW